MKKIICIAICFAFIANVSAQLEIDAAGDARFTGNIYLGNSTNLITTTNNVPITFKVNGILAGYTGNSVKNNVSFGYGALHSNTGYENVANGAYALYSNTTGFGNTANGIVALYSNTTGIGNTGIGGGALYSNTTSGDNTANGGNALYRNTTGSDNTANGAGALFYNTTGNYNTAIGSWAGVYTNNLNNTTAIGYDVLATSSNQVRIGNSSVTSIGGYAAWTNLSDRRAKKNIRADVPGLTFINRLQPVTYNLDLDAIDGLLKIDRTKKHDKEALPEGQGELPQKELSPELVEINKKAREAKEKVIQTGFIAQDVETIAKSIGYDFSGVDVDEIGIYGLRYAEFVVPLVKAVQELSEQNNQLQAQNNQLQAQNDQIQAQINELTELVYSLQGKDTDPALLRSKSAGEAAIGLQDAASSGASLQQNTPNPFNQTTVIRYTLPQTCASAQLVVSNTVGNVVRQIPLQTGTDSITIEGGTLAVGIYYYSLYVDNSLVDTKKMILTK